MQQVGGPLHEEFWCISWVDCLELGMVSAGIVVLGKVNDSDILVMGVAIPVL